MAFPLQTGEARTMAADAEVVAALEVVLAADPGASAVRRHLIEVLLAGDDAAAALRHCDVLLAHAPGDPGVLAFVADVCDRTDQPGRAAATRLLASMLDAPLTSPPEPTRRDDHAMSPDVFGDELDQFLRDVLRQHDAQQVTLADVGGLHEVKARLEASFLAPMRRPDLRQAYGKSLRGGLLMWGPPGCGKTFLARAIAGELGANFIPVGIHDVLDMYVGNSERNIRSFFDAARRCRPSVLFFDEIDALGYSRGRHSAGTLRNVVALLLTELDGVASENDEVFVLAATNQPWDVDPALRRPGRFDRTVLVLPPDRDARRSILEVNLRGRPTESIDLGRIAAATEGFSGADLRLLCETAVEEAMTEAHRTGALQPITQRHLDASMSGIRPSTGPWLESAKNYVSYANTSGEYDELAAFLRRRGKR